MIPFIIENENYEIMIDYKCTLNHKRLIKKIGDL